MEIDPESAQGALQKARQALQQGDTQAARRWAETAASLRPDLEEPWLILAAYSSPQESTGYLERALRINPGSEHARKGMQWAVNRLQNEVDRLKSEYLPPGTPDQIASSQPVSQSEPAKVEKSEKEIQVIYVQAPPQAPPANPTKRVARYLAGKALTIAATIFIGVFLTVLLVSQPTRRGMGASKSPFETSLERQLYLVIQNSLSSGGFSYNPMSDADQGVVNALTKMLRHEVGLDLPFLPRNLLWTFKALTFNWGRFGERQSSSWFAVNRATASAKDIILGYLPNTLLLVGTGYLLVFLIGLPLSLHLARNYGKRMDRLFTFLAPISSIPSWVFGLLLITIFAVELRWLPFGGKYDYFTPSQPLEGLLVVSKHMILPVASIVLSLLFQVVYAWRTFFIIYSEEDYVELAKAKGLSTRRLEKHYILKPALPYFITSFATTLIGFWQLSMALEVAFHWPGLGWLYVKEALPNFFGESMEPGELIIVIGIVVIFAYLLGIMAFLLDLVYVIVDPRIRLLPGNIDMEKQAGAGSWSTRWIERWKHRKKQAILGKELQMHMPERQRGLSWAQRVADLKRSLREHGDRSRLFFRELFRYPSAVFGFAVILILFAGSIYAVTAFPYAQVGRDYEEKRMGGRATIPRTAMPQWMNLFSATPWLSIMTSDQNSPEASITSRMLDNGWIEKTITFTFDFKYKAMPSEVFLYFDPAYTKQPPFVTLTWIYPDGRVVELKRTTAAPSSSYDFETGIPVAQLLAKNPGWRKWYDTSAQYTKPTFSMLFAQPNTTKLELQRGTYQLTLTTLLFEPDSELNPQLVLLGQTYGLVGTDYARRDLIVPFFWGMPFALFIGLLGTLITTLVAVLLPSIGVWYGGWVDTLVQRLSEINMVLPGLAIAVLVNVLFNLNIWVVLGIVVVINAFGSPLKTIRSALLQAKEAPYIESARSYGASNFRIITRYLLPRILPVVIPQLVTQVPAFIFWEATLGFFNIQTTYPTWGRIIYDGLANGALYGSPFWVLEPIFLLLLTGFAFAMLGSALERVLNPRTLDEAAM
jgi:peptide/nickel transport system permease protein